LTLDVADEQSRRAAIAEVEAAEGTVGALVNNAGFSLGGPVGGQ
jgi:NADP-dependent 3-hydroxy acid dehydrogenase YdfG